ncbi:hypothetical protein N0V93_001862 [Gnomoniopsis smithogilvyi]|uniref:Amidase domain-containing protein n=1 Tax=Gnomoniopsis smithogilvyi TaxID=1191159 RepID=A0A9W8Z2T8_9PEZI|nr:hypothetical protein N0V93_001862 [Gnomoniopsis smithogilvyi]
MAPPRRFADYPGAKEALNISYKTEEGQNPVMRGLPLTIGAAIVTRSTALQRFLYGNAGFAKLSAIESLDDEKWRFDPTVIPLSDTAAPPPPPTFEPALLTAQPADTPGRFASFADYRALYTSGAATPLDVVEALLPLIRRDVPSPTVYSRAWLDIHVDEVRAAARASTERYAAGKPLGPLDGIPFGVKSDCAVKGYVNTVGMRPDPRVAFFNRPADASIWPVRKLEEAGAVMVGKMNQHEIGMDTTGCNPRTGTPINFYNRSYYPGGSSSGAGSSLGAGLVPLAVGTDAGGSIRVPTTSAGCTALKPSHNRTVVLQSSMCIVGPMCANVNDLAIAYRIMAQPDLADPVAGLFAPSEPPAPTDKKLLGICHPWVAQASADVREVFDRAVAFYTKDLGYEVVDIDIPLIHEARIAHGAVNLAEAADHAKARVPPAETAATGIKWTDLLAPANAVTCCVGAQTTANDYMKFAQVRSVVMRHLAFLFEKHGKELLIVTPTLPDAGYAITEGDETYGFTDGNRCIRSMMYVWLANMTGCPATTVNGGYVAVDKGEGSLPVGVMALGMWGEEERCLTWASEGEKFLGEKVKGGRRRPEGWVDVVTLAKEGKTAK